MSVLAVPLTPAVSYLAATAHHAHVTEMRNFHAPGRLLSKYTQASHCGHTSPLTAQCTAMLPGTRSMCRICQHLSEDGARAGQHLVALLDARVHAHIPPVTEGHRAWGRPPAGDCARAGHEALGRALSVHTRLKGMPLHAGSRLMHDHHHTVPASIKSSHTFLPGCVTA